MRAAITFLAISTLFAAGAAAQPLGPTRAEYVRAVEPICRAETNANRTVLHGVEEMVADGELKRAAPRLLRASNALDATVKKLAAVPRPPADLARLTRWLGFAKSGGARLREIGVALRQDERSRVQTLTKQLLAEAKRANATVVGFNFEYCRVNPARFV